MMPLFSEDNLKILESLSFTKTLYAFDFDGTLSQIVRKPSDAIISKTTNKLIEKLSMLAPIAIVSGRSVEDLKKKLIYQPLYLIGNHGLEGFGGSSNHALRSAEQNCKSWDATLKKIDFGAGVEIENKTFSIAIHYRRSRNKKLSKEKIIAAIESLTSGPRIIPGKFVFNLLPRQAPHKGMAVMELLNKTNTKYVFYIGDDDSVANDFSLTSKNIFTVRVGKKKNS